jgi:hypothetical protein
MPNNLLDWLFKHFDKEYDAHKWAQLVGVQIIDPDGWRKNAKIGELPIPPPGVWMTRLGWRNSSGDCLRPQSAHCQNSGLTQRTRVL